MIQDFKSKDFLFSISLSESGTIIIIISGMQRMQYMQEMDMIMMDTDLEWNSPEVEALEVTEVATEVVDQEVTEVVVVEDLQQEEVNSEYL